MSKLALKIKEEIGSFNRHPDKPLVFDIAWKTAIYMLIAMLVHYLERLIDFLGAIFGPL